jgi:hypothetical protein
MDGTEDMSCNNGQSAITSSVPLDQSHEVHFQSFLNDEMINIAQDHTYSMLSFVDGSELYKFAQLMEINPNWKRLAISKQLYHHIIYLNVSNCSYFKIQFSCSCSYISN